MKGVTIRALMESALLRMERDGVSEKMLTSYKTSGFGAIVRYCEEIGRPSYSEHAIDEFIQQSRSEYEHGEISAWKWQHIRRGGELLKHFHKTENLDLPPHVQWEALHNPLHREPTTIELDDASNIFTLVWRTKQEMLKFNLTPKSMQNYLYDGFDHILRSHIGIGLTKYSSELSKQLADRARDKYTSGEMCRSVYQNVRRTAALLDEFYETGTLTWHYLPSYGLREPNNTFAELLSKFCENTNRIGDMKQSSVAHIRSLIRRFFLNLKTMVYIH